MLVLLSLACDDDNNDSGNGDNGTKDPKSTTVSVPENLSSDETRSRDGAYILSWDEVSGASTYKLREGETELELSSDDIQNRTHSVSGKETGSYDYQVQACDANDACSEWSSAITVHVFTASAPALTLTSTETRATDGAYRSADGIYTLTWTSVTDAATYELQEVIQEGNREIYSGDANTHDVSGEMAKMTGSYRYQIRACHANGVCSNWSSDPLTVHVFTASAPTWVSEESISRDGSYTLRWAPVTDAATYELQEVMSESNTPLSLTPEDVQNRTHMISDKTDGSYSYRVRACHSNGVCSSWSNTLSLSVSINCTGKTMQQASGFNYGDGSSDSPYLICDYAQLKKMGEDDDALTKHYKLGQDINAIDSRSDGTKRSSTTDTDCKPYDPTLAADAPTTTDGHPSNGDTCTGWKPVGDNTNPFTGSLQGAGYEIRNLYINISTTIATTRVGLFGQTGRAGEIQNVGVTNAYIKVDSSNSEIGGLVGLSAGRISNSYVTGTVTVAFISDIGGLVGENQGSISNSYAAGSLSAAPASRVGGLVGYNTGSISNSYVTVTDSITGGSASHIGGLVGENQGSISNSYAAGSLSAAPASRVGGLVGRNAGSISDSYATGSVTGSASRAGGLVGQNDRSITGKNYFVDTPASDSNMDGIGGSTGFCGASAMDSVNVCIRATGADDDARKIWLQNTLDESLSTDMGGMGWLPANWEGFVGTGVGYPKLKYAQVDGFCTKTPDTLDTEEKCVASRSCSVGAHATEELCTTNRGMWIRDAWWLAGGDECGGSTGVRCGDVIPGQD